jgi:hypothetical protein
MRSVTTTALQMMAIAGPAPVESVSSSGPSSSVRMPQVAQQWVMNQFFGVEDDQVAVPPQPPSVLPEAQLVTVPCETEFTVLSSSPAQVSGYGIGSMLELVSGAAVSSAVGLAVGAGATTLLSPTALLSPMTLLSPWTIMLVTGAAAGTGAGAGVGGGVTTITTTCAGAGAGVGAWHLYCHPLQLKNSPPHQQHVFVLSIL